MFQTEGHPSGSHVECRQAPELHRTHQRTYVSSRQSTAQDPNMPQHTKQGLWSGCDQQWPRPRFEPKGRAHESTSRPGSNEHWHRVSPQSKPWGQSVLTTNHQSEQTWNGATHVAEVGQPLPLDRTSHVQDLRIGHCDTEARLAASAIGLHHQPMHHFGCWGSPSVHQWWCVASKGLEENCHR